TALSGDCSRFWSTAIAQNNGPFGSGQGSPDSSASGCSNRRKALHAELGGGASVTYSSMGLVDTAPFDPAGPFGAGSLVGDTVVVNGGQFFGTVGSNTTMSI